jgi:hypothetical protein
VWLLLYLVCTAVQGMIMHLPCSYTVGVTLGHCTDLPSCLGRLVCVSVWGDMGVLGTWVPCPARAR